MYCSYQVFLTFRLQKKKLKSWVKQLDRMSESQRRDDPAWLSILVYKKRLSGKLKKEPSKIFGLTSKMVMATGRMKKKIVTAISAANELAKG
jgi:hypothetical protein